jgi:hypothetical protein
MKIQHMYRHSLHSEALITLSLLITLIYFVFHVRIPWSCTLSEE